ncbi:unnamed protein product [Schistosoma turkestanicum]|nr:unnamed protein product [Schistosoma turkestanicum]
MRRKIEISRSPSGYGFRLRNECPCLIDHVLTGSAAEKSGVRTGDILLKVNGVDVFNVSHEEVALLIWQCRTKLYIEVVSQESELSQCITSPSEVSSLNSRCMIGCKQKTFYRSTSMFVYVGCVPVPTDFKSCIKDLSVLRRKTNSMVNKIQVNSISICLVSVSDVLQVRLHDTYIAKYPASCLYAAGLVDFDEKFFYVVTRSRTKGRTASVKSMNCHVFRTLPAKFLSHSGHITIAKTFGIHCSYDRLTGECCNFPSSTTCTLSYLHAMLANAGLRNTMDIGDLQSISRRSSEIYHTPPDISSAGFQLRPNSMTLSFQDPSHHANQANVSHYHSGNFSVDKCVSPKRSRSSLPEPINPNLISKFLKATSSLSSRIVGTKNSLETIKSNCDEQSPKINCFSSTTIESEDIENIEPSNPASWAKDFDNLLNDAVGCNEFRKFLITEFSAENLDFLLSVRSWRHAFEAENVKEKANEIFNKFLVPDAPQAVNVDHAAIKSASSYLSHPHIDMFLEAENQVYILMKTDSFPRFLNSSNYSFILNNFNANKSTTRKSTVLNHSKIFKNKSDISSSIINKMSSKILTTNNQIVNDENKLISSKVEISDNNNTHAAIAQLNKNKSLIVLENDADDTVTPGAKIQRNLNKEFNAKSFKSNLIRLKR